MGEVESLICNFYLSVAAHRIGEVESLICNFYLNVAAHRIAWADPSQRYATTFAETLS